MSGEDFSPAQKSDYLNLTVRNSCQHVLGAENKVAKWTIEAGAAGRVTGFDEAGDIEIYWKDHRVAGLYDVETFHGMQLMRSPVLDRFEFFKREMKQRQARRQQVREQDQGRRGRTNDGLVGGR